MNGSATRSNRRTGGIGEGRIAGASGDRQFRIYVRLKPSAIDTLDRSREFKRGVDNTVYHHGYPINYRQQGGDSLDPDLDRDRPPPSGHRCRLSIVGFPSLSSTGT